MVSLCILHVQKFVLQESSHLRMGGPVANSELEVRKTGTCWRPGDLCIPCNRVVTEL